MSSLSEQTKEDIQIIQNNDLRCCLNITDPRNVNILEILTTPMYNFLNIE